MFQVILSGDLPGLYFNADLVISGWELRKLNLDLVKMQGWNQKSLARLAERTS